MAKDLIKEEDDAATKAGLIVGLSCTLMLLITAGYLINKKKREEYALLEEGGSAEDSYRRFVDEELTA